VKIEIKGKHKTGSTTGSNCGMITPEGYQESKISWPYVLSFGKWIRNSEDVQNKMKKLCIKKR